MTVDWQIVMPIFWLVAGVVVGAVNWRETFIGRSAVGRVLCTDVAVLARRWFRGS